MRILEPAVKEINNYSDIKIYWEITDKDGKKVTEITFHMAEKNVDEMLDAQRAGLTKLDGNIHWWDSEPLPGQIGFLKNK